VIEGSLFPFRKSGEDLREDRFSFADHSHIRYAASEKEGMAEGDLRASDNHPHPAEGLFDPPQKVKGALDVPQMQGTTDDVRLSALNLLRQVPVIELLLVRRQPPALIFGGKPSAP
jgi:hypothetical protein